MRTIRVSSAIALLALGQGCAEAPLEPLKFDAGPARHVGIPASSCPLATLPASARVLLCFNTTLQPGVWHGWFIEVSAAQPPSRFDGDADRSRLNHQYLLASPAGYTRWGPGDPMAPTGTETSNIHAFQAESNGTLWIDVLRLVAAPGTGPQSVPVVVFWLDAAGAAGEVVSTVQSLLDAGALNAGQSNALNIKVAHALAFLEAGKDAQAVNMLLAFIQQVTDLTAGHVLSPSESAPLVMWARYFIDSI
jgi:hypothetical protein